MISIYTAIGFITACLAGLFTYVGYPWLGIAVATFGISCLVSFFADITKSNLEELYSALRN